MKPVLAALAVSDIRGISHITGGGFYENIPRSLPQGLGARIERNAIHTPLIFKVLQERGGIPERDMFNTFNMGVGMSVVVSADTADRALYAFEEAGVSAYPIGEIAASDEPICFC